VTAPAPARAVRSARSLGALMALCAAGAIAAPVGASRLTDAEAGAVLRHGPWPAPWSPDPSNRASGDARAAALGERLFFDPRLSPSGTILCATCHAPFRGWQDGRARARGLADADRNTLSVMNVRYARWFGWDGANDSLWAQSIRPILQPREMGGSAAQAAALLRGDAELACRWREAFGGPPPASDDAVLAGIGKALAAFEETLVTGRSPFDEFRDALARGDSSSMERYPAAALRGLRMFVGEAHCSTCHAGPDFSDGGFYRAGGASAAPDRMADRGRYAGVEQLLASPFNLLGEYNDDATRASAARTRRVAPHARDIGRFRVPSLRNVALTAPYMHDGSVATLAGAVRHSPGARLDARETADLVAFLESLTERTSALPARGPAAPCAGR